MKEKSKKFFAVLLASALLCGGLPCSAEAAGFGDVPADAWYKDYVYDLVEKGVISGTSPTTFSPDKTLTRAEFATMLARSVLSEGDLRQYEYKGSFKDVPLSFWGNRYINWAQEAGVVSGCGDGTFAPYQPVTRQQMAVMVVNLAKATGRQMSPVNNTVSFTDGGSIARYAAESVRVCQRAGVISGYTDGSFRPNGKATRSEAASLYSNFLKKCVTGNYRITRKRVFSTPVRAVEFDPALYTPQLLLGNDVADGGEAASSMVSRSGAVIAVNAAFFDMESYQALGTLIKDGRVVTTSEKYAPYKPALTLDASGKFSVQSFSTSHTVTLHKEDGTDSVLKGVVVNRWPSSKTDGARILYTRDWGHTLCYKAKDAVTLAEDGTILAIDHDKDVTIPETGYVLAQRSRREYEGDFFDSCKIGDVLDVERVYEGLTCGEPVLSIGTGPRIVKNKAVYGDLSTYRAEGYTDPGITSYEALRLCTGIRQDGHLVLVSAYATLSKMSEIMVSFGCTDAVNFDGGGSTTLYVDGQWLRSPDGRALNNMLIFK